MAYSVDDLLKFDIPEIIYGPGALSVIGRCAARLGGEKIFLVTDPGIIRAGWVDQTLQYLKRMRLDCVVYDNVVGNPRDFQVDQGAKLYLQKKCDVIVAVGGGSTIDTAKGIGVLATNYGSVKDFVGCNLVSQPIPPLICAPTTAGTGADVSQFAVLLDSREKMKMCILSRVIMPDISIIDPTLLQTKSQELIAATGMDTLTHAIEAYVSSLSWPMTDPHAVHAIELVNEHLVRAAETKDIVALEGMAVACLEAGIAFSNAILGAVHALAHPVGGIYDLHHGVVNSVLLPAVVRRNLDHAHDKFAVMARALGVKTRGMSTAEAAFHVPEKIEELISRLGLPRHLAELGVSSDDIPMMAEMAQQDICMLTNPCTYSTRDIEAMYREVW
ncbi:iron-containing alcohol dehydrogenase [Desulfococcus sp.]|uniref:iron-containing alcohol dehydrogenase n=1 Tax=Desulfococcus sp. TaxID=2025834 RepID=UPI00359457DD